MPEDFFHQENDNYNNSSDVESSLNPGSPTIMNIAVYSDAQTTASPSLEVDSNSSDEAPEAVHFAASRTLAMKEIMNAAEAVRNQKQRLKEKRRQNQELLAAQKQKKKQRLADLASKRLPSDILEQIVSSDYSQNETVNANSFASKKEPIRIHDGLAGKRNQNISSECVSSATSIDKPRKRSRVAVHQYKPTEQMPPKETLDFIPLNSKATEFHVRVLDERVDSVVGKVASLTDWKNSLLYNKSKPRETSRQALAKVGKQATAGLDCFPTVSHKSK